jgi:plastocyanin
MINKRTLRDLNLSVSIALPAQAATSNTASIDTTEANPGRLGKVEAMIELPATPSLAAGQTITLTLQDSADNVTFANSVDVPAQVVTSSGAGGALVSYQFKFPIGMKRYIRLSQVASATAGNNTAISGMLSLVF